MGVYSDDEQDESFDDMSTKEYIILNASKMVTEIIGTASLGIFYILMGDQSPAVFLSFWIITLFGFNMSGSHFNPSISLCMMFRSDSPFGNTGRERTLGIMYIIG